MIQLRYFFLLFISLVGAALIPALNSESGGASTDKTAAGSSHAIQSYCPGERYSIKTPPLSSEPYIQLTIGGKTGQFLIDYGATASSVENGVLATGAGPITLAGPKLPGLPAQNQFAVFDRNITQQGVGEQWGVIGTDFLSKMVVEMRFENANDEHLVVSPSCDTSKLASRGFWKFDQKGFFSANPAGQKYPNVPVLHIDFQKGWNGNAIGTKTWAQIDPGYGDRFRPYSIDINDAYYTKLVAAKIPLVEVESIGFTDCEGKARTDLVYVVPGHLLRIEAPDGSPMYRHSSYHLVRKGKASPSCGGIAQLNDPAAQFGSSFLRVFGRMIFDPAHEAVWILPTTFVENIPSTSK